MARFHTQLISDKGNIISRYPNNSTYVQVNGWNSGIMVEAIPISGVITDTVDKFRIYITGGSTSPLKIVPLLDIEGDKCIKYV